jgi:serine/threonine-protein kinase
MSQSAFNLHLRIGQEALAKGLEPRRFAEAMMVVAELCSQAPPPIGKQAIRALWVDGGFLSQAQLDAVMAGIAGDDTLHAVAQPKSTSQPTVHLVSGAPKPGPAVVVPGAVMLAGRYRRLGILGEGGLGEVVACLDQALGRTVAVKLTRIDHDRPADAHLILDREAAIIASLEHPNIVPVYDAGRDDSRGPFYVMRQLTQPSLDHVLTRLRSREPEAVREYTLGRLLRYFWQVCRALDFAHSRGVVHCDLKPANILLGDFGEVLVVDWGLAQMAEQRVRVRGGTPGYMAPEQYDPSVQRFDARTDVFALGAILYEIMTLRRAFASDDPHDEKALPPTQPPVPPRARVPELEIPVELEDICLRALDRDPSYRMPSAGAMAGAIDEFMEGTKERERRRQEADARCQAGDELAERYHEFVESAPEHHARLVTMRAEVAPWEPLEKKRDLWDAEDMAAVTEALRVRTLQSAVSSYEQALDAMPHHPGARRGLAKLFHAELMRARQERDALDQIYFENLVRQHDTDGTYARVLAAPGKLVLDLRGEPVEIRVALLRLVIGGVVFRQIETVAPARRF